MKPKTRVRIICHEVESNTGWASSELVLQQYDQSEVLKRVTIEIRDPYDIASLREAIEKIENGWRRSLGVAS